MIALPERLLAAYQLELGALGMGSADAAAWRRWARFYVDFCLKYGHPPRSQDSIPKFVEKLIAKGQPEEKRAQAARAVRVLIEVLRQFPEPGEGEGSDLPDDGEDAETRSSPGARMTEIGKRSGPGETGSGVSWEAEFAKLADALAVGQYALTTRRSYTGWARRFQGFLGSSPPGRISSEDAARFLTFLASEERVGAATQNQAFNALLFLFKNVLDQEFKPEGVARARVTKYVPQTPEQLSKVFRQTDRNRLSEIRCFARGGEFRPKPHSCSVYASLRSPSAGCGSAGSIGGQSARSRMPIRFASASLRPPGSPWLAMSLRSILAAPRFCAVLTRPFIGKLLRTALTGAEIEELTGYLPDPYRLLARLMYGSGLRLAEALSLRVHNFDFDLQLLTIHRGKGQKDRTVPLPAVLAPELKEHLASVKETYETDLAAGFEGAFMPVRGSKKNWDQIATRWQWQFFFPAARLTRVGEGESYGWRRYHLHNNRFSEALRKAVAKLGTHKKVTAHTFRHSFASHLVMANFDIKTVQEMMGHSDVRTTMIYLQTVPARTKKDRMSPLDLPPGSGI